MANVSDPETLTAEAYSHYLQIQTAFLQIIEPRLKVFLEATPLACRLNKASLANSDLQCLAYPSIPVKVESQPDTSFIKTYAHALGSLYVIEGSTLGMRLLAKALAEKSWSSRSGKLVNVYGQYHSEMWRNFQVYLNDLPQESWEACRLGAMGTFQLLLDLIAVAEEAESV